MGGCVEREMRWGGGDVDEWLGGDIWGVDR